MRCISTPTETLRALAYVILCPACGGFKTQGDSVSGLHGPEVLWLMLARGKHDHDVSQLGSVMMEVQHLTGVSLAT